MNNKDKKGGFTYVELLGVIAIIGIITLIALPIINRVQEKNKTTKYKTYAEALKNSGKLYTDSYSKDMFGYAKNGCYDIKYSQLKSKNLINDIKIDEVTCDYDDKKTFVRVTKTKDNYKYEVAIECKDKKNKIVYENKLDAASCDGGEDKLAPEISISPTNMDWTRGLNKKTTVTISDFYGLLENQKIRYAWTTTPTSINESEYTAISFENKKGVNDAKTEIPLPTDKTGNYYLVIQPINVRDINGNYQTNSTQAGIFKLDNTKPRCGTNNGTRRWSNTAKTITVKCTDGESGCTNNSFSKKFTATMDKGRITIKDKVGNTNDCVVDVYLDTLPPSTSYLSSASCIEGCKSVTSTCTRYTGSSMSNECKINVVFDKNAAYHMLSYGFARFDMNEYGVESNLSGDKPYSDEYKWYSNNGISKNQLTWTTTPPDNMLVICAGSTYCYLELRYYDNAGNVSNKLRTYFYTEYK